MELMQAAVLASDLQGKILVGVEHHHVGEAQAFLMTAYQLFKHGCETLACAKTQHTLTACCLCGFDLCLNGVGDKLCALLHLWEDLGCYFLTTSDL